MDTLKKSVKIIKSVTLKESKKDKAEIPDHILAYAQSLG